MAPTRGIAGRRNECNEWLEIPTKFINAWGGMILLI